MCKFDKPYAERLRAGEINYDDIDNYVEYWYKHETGVSLQDFLGMTKEEFVKWIKYGDMYICDILGVETEPPEMPVCKMCGQELGIRLDDRRIICKSDYIEGNDYCHVCQVEHCMNTNCLGCQMGNYPDCRHLDLKKSYMESSRIEAEEEAKAQEEVIENEA